jgi:hypothetical protein
MWHRPVSMLLDFCMMYLHHWSCWLFVLYALGHLLAWAASYSLHHFVPHGCFNCLSYLRAMTLVWACRLADTEEEISGRNVYEKLPGRHLWSPAAWLWCYWGLITLVSSNGMWVGLFVSKSFEMQFAEVSECTLCPFKLLIFTVYY